MNRTVEQRESLKIERLRLATSICCSVIINEDLRIAMFRDSKNKNFNPDKLTPDDYIDRVILFAAAS